MLKVIGAGLSRTGTHSLHAALEALGMHSVHFDSERLNDIVEGVEPHPNFRRYDDVDAVIDLPASLFYKELADAYPDAKVVLTLRDTDEWWRGIKRHFEINYVANERLLRHRLVQKLGVAYEEAPIDRFRRALRQYAYGSTVPSEYLYKKRFDEHNRLVQATIPPERLLVIDITKGDGYQKLCPFLGLDPVASPFPHLFAANDVHPEEAAAIEAIHEHH
ncbi:MAG: sulfotransferase [Terricaulis sp.]